jgi:hypothetical protein
MDWLCKETLRMKEQRGAGLLPYDFGVVIMEGKGKTVLSRSGRLVNLHWARRALAYFALARRLYGGYQLA